MPEETNPTETIMTTPDVPSEDSINLPNEQLEVARATEEEIIKRMIIKQKVDDLLEELKPLIREEDYSNIRALEESAELSDVINYLQSNIPEVATYIGTSSKTDVTPTLTDDDKIGLIKKGLKARAESMVPNYKMPPPFLGKDIDEARGKQENAEVRHQAQYGQVPASAPVFRGRSAIDNPYYTPPSNIFKPSVYRNPIKHKNKNGKVPRIKFL